MDPMRYLTTFDYGKVTPQPDGTSQREYFVIAQDKEIEVAEGIRFPAWTYNGFLPGPTLRATVGDRIILFDRPVERVLSAQTLRGIRPFADFPWQHDQYTQSAQQPLTQQPQPQYR